MRERERDSAFVYSRRRCVTTIHPFCILQIDPLSRPGHLMLARGWERERELRRAGIQERGRAMMKKTRAERDERRVRPPPACPPPSSCPMMLHVHRYCASVHSLSWSLLLPVPSFSPSIFPLNLSRFWTIFLMFTRYTIICPSLSFFCSQTKKGCSFFTQKTLSSWDDR